MQEETLEGAGHSGSRGEPLSVKGLQELKLSRPFHTFLPFSPISYGSLLFHIPKLIAEQWFYWNFTYSQYWAQVLSPGDQPVEPSPCSLLPAPAQATCTSNLELQEGHTSSPVSALPHPSESLWGFTGTRSSTPPTSREDRSNPSSLEQNEEETNTDLFCL